ncbi:MAG: hypothetical protein E7426_08955 [Ruminococcaceae bacterium]|jgi:hypothetical protein|nr:hypothetical protein [Oscillospiraceae bacterium]
MDKKTRRYSSGRSSLLAVVIFGAVNTVLALVGSNTYFLFSNYLAYIEALKGRMVFAFTGGTGALVRGALIALAILAVYLVCWLLSKKQRIWLLLAALLFLVDTGIVVSDLLQLGAGDLFMDLLFHVFVLVSLLLGFAAGKSAQTTEKAPEQREPWDAPPTRSGTGDSDFYDMTDTAPQSGYDGLRPDSRPIGLPAEKARVLVEADCGGHHIQTLRSRGLTELVIDGRVYGRQEGVIETEYTISAVVDGREIATSFSPSGRQSILVDGEVIAKKQRLY